MSADKDNRLLRLRLIVGYLGEEGQYNWWSSNFFSLVSNSFLEPVFPRTINLARYNGVREAACRVHDEHIGIGRVFHLFRLPESAEFRLHQAARDESNMAAALADVSSQDAAMAALETWSAATAEHRAGPIRIGDSSTLSDGSWVEAAGAEYLAAFRAGGRSYPYLTAAE